MKSIRITSFFLLILAPPLVFSGCDGKKKQSPISGKAAGRNLLFVTLDTTRADRIGCYGYSTAATPALDGLAKRGALFERAYAQAPLTMVSHATMLTGLYPKEHGIRDNGNASLASSHPTLATVFKSHGYKTGAFVGAYVLDHRFGLSNGFDRYDDDMGKVELGAQLAERQRRANVVTDSALTWLEQNKSGPFCCWVHYYDPHEPYDPPAEFRAKHPKAYDGEIAFMDSQLKRILDWLESKNLSDKTTIVIAGDHGEAFGEHGEKGHAMFVYEMNVRVPLIFVDPAIPAGQRVSTYVELADIFPTILDMFGFASPAKVNARDVAPALAGQKMPDQDCYSESHTLFNSHGFAELRSLTTPEWKYISSTRPELYDRAADPDELHNLIDQRKDVAKQMLTRLLDRYESWTAGDPLKLSETEESRKALQALGYVGGGGRVSTEFLTPGLPDPKEKLPTILKLQDANHLLQLEKYAEALPILEEAVAQIPNSMMARYILGTTYLKLGKNDQAVSTLEAALKIDTKVPSVWISMGDALMLTGRTEEAHKHYAASLTQDDTSPIVYHKLSQTSAKLGRMPETVKYLRKAIELRPDFAEALYDLGVILAEQNNLPEAIRCYRDAAKSRPEDAPTHYNLGVALLRTGDLSGAFEQLNEAIRLKPDYGEAYINLGICLGTQGKIEEARAVLEKAVAIPASAADAHFNLGVTFSKAGDLQNAVAHYEKAFELKPAKTQAAEEIIKFYMRNQLMPDAVRVLRKGVEAAPDNLKFVNTLAEVLATARDDTLRDGPASLKLILPACEKTNYQSPVLLGTLAAAYGETGDFDKAIETSRKAIDAAKAANQPKLAELFAPQLEQFEKKQPYRNPKY